MNLVIQLNGKILELMVQLTKWKVDRARFIAETGESPSIREPLLPARRIPKKISNNFLQNKTQKSSSIMSNKSKMRATEKSNSDLLDWTLQAFGNQVRIYIQLYI